MGWEVVNLDLPANQRYNDLASKKTKQVRFTDRQNSAEQIMFIYSWVLSGTRVLHPRNLGEKLINPVTAAHQESFCSALVRAPSRYLVHHVPCSCHISPLLSSFYVQNCLKLPVVSLLLSIMIVVASIASS